jgi:LytS/YehU family sensor histidine kinase
MLKKKKNHNLTIYLSASLVAFALHYCFWYVVDPIIFDGGGFPFVLTLIKGLYSVIFACATIAICDVVICWGSKRQIDKYTLTLGLLVTNILVFLFAVVFVLSLNAILWEGNMNEVPHGIFIYYVIGLLISCAYVTWKYGLHLLSNEQIVAKMKLDQIKRGEEIANLQISILTEQINPHFIFNTLNVICAYVGPKPDKAICMIGEFADLYRYIAKHLTDKCERIDDAVNFNKQYLSMILCGCEDQYVCELDVAHVDGYLPLLSLQLVVENALAHNKHTVEEPLYIKMSCVGDYICVLNSNNPIQHSNSSLSIGLANLSRRYDLLCGKKIDITETAQFYTVKLPIIHANELPDSRG